MHIPLEAVLNLLHVAADGTLATHSVEMPGYPFLSALPFAPDERHCPVFLISGLAEHTRNLRADPRAALLVLQSQGRDVQAGPRLTLLGHVEPCTPNAELASRYLRYQPSARRYLTLADFGFYRLEPERLRMIEGFGRMGWLEGRGLLETVPLSLLEEADLVRRNAADLPSGTALLGIDRYGLDLDLSGSRRRVPFEHGPVTDEALSTAVRSSLGRLRDAGGASANHRSD